MDASLKGMAEKFKDKLYGVSMDNKLQNLCTIVYLEAANIMLAANLEIIKNVIGIGLKCSI